MGSCLSKRPKYKKQAQEEENEVKRKEEIKEDQEIKEVREEIKNKEIIEVKEIDIKDEMKEELNQIELSSLDNSLFYNRNEIIANSQMNDQEENQKNDKNDWRQIKSEQRGTGKCQLKVINNLNYIVIFCWIGFDGTLFHFRRVNDQSIRDGSVKNEITEHSTIYHSFVCFTFPSTDMSHVKKLEDLNPEVYLSISLD